MLLNYALFLFFCLLEIYNGFFVTIECIIKYDNYLTCTYLFVLLARIWRYNNDDEISCDIGSQEGLTSRSASRTVTAHSRTEIRTSHSDIQQLELFATVLSHHLEEHKRSCRIQRFGQRVAQTGLYQCDSGHSEIWLRVQNHVFALQSRSFGAIARRGAKGIFIIHNDWITYKYSILFSTYVTLDKCALNIV